MVFIFLQRTRKQLGAKVRVIESGVAGSGSGGGLAKVGGAEGTRGTAVEGTGGNSRQAERAGAEFTLAGASVR